MLYPSEGSSLISMVLGYLAMELPVVLIMNVMIPYSPSEFHHFVCCYPILKMWFIKPID
jgi:hypothetical protein